MHYTEEEWSTGDKYYIKASSEEIWDSKRQPGNQMVFCVILVVPLDADEYNGVIYSIFCTDYLKNILSSVER